MMAVTKSIGESLVIGGTASTGYAAGRWGRPTSRPHRKARPTSRCRWSGWSAWTQRTDWPLTALAALFLAGRVGIYVAGLMVLVSGCASLAVLDAERGSPDANITDLADLADAPWWTLTTITAVGYGDLYPTTGEGRVVAAALMIGGIALLGVVTGMVASWFVEKIKGVELSIEETTQREVRTLRAELAALRAQLDQRASEPR